MKLTRRNVMKAMAGFVPALGLSGAQRSLPPGIEASGKNPAATRASLAEFEIPAWFQDAKFGLWAHWGPQSAVEAGDWYARNMYMQGSNQYEYHCEHYGHPSTFGFKDTIPAWKAQDFDAAHLIQLYKNAGAKYFVSMGVHHDNFDMWNSKHNRWNAVNMGPKKDILGMWQKAATDAGLRFGVSEHLWISYKWFSVSHGHDATGPKAGVPYDGADPQNLDYYIDSDQVWTDLDWNEDGIPEWWKRHWYDRMTDLIDNYHPDLLYTDGALPFEDYGVNAVAHLHKVSAARHGGKSEAVYNSKRLQDGAMRAAVLDRERGVVDKIWPTAWQTDTCIGDWHYKRGVKYKTPKMVIDMLVDIVSRNGNLLLNFPLPASGALDLEELAVLDGITKWMAVNSEAIYATRPWKIFGEGPGTASSATDSNFNEQSRKDLTDQDVRFTTKGGTLYAFVMGWPDYQAVIRPLALDKPLRVGKISNVELLGFDGKLEWSQDTTGLKIMTPARKPSDHAVVFKVTGV